MARMPDVRYRQARYDFGPRSLSDILGLNWHMAESAPGGCVSCYLAGNPARGVSANFVVEDTGEIVQCLGTDRIPGTVNPNDIRTTDDADGFYGISTAKAVLGEKWFSPNRYQITVEVGGKASVGPNAEQAASILELRDWCYATHVNLRGQTGHRDFTSRKACPGKLGIFRVPWPELHHGLWQPGEEPDDVKAVIPVTDTNPQWVTASKGAQIFAFTEKSSQLEPVTTLSADSTLYSPFGRGADWYAVRVSTGATDYDGPELLAIRRSAVTAVKPYCEPSTDCKEQVMAEYERMRKASVTAIAAIPPPK